MSDVPPEADVGEASLLPNEAKEAANGGLSVI
jgi:hypothetical protein